MNEKTTVFEGKTAEKPQFLEQFSKAVTRYAIYSHDSNIFICAETQMIVTRVNQFGTTGTLVPAPTQSDHPPFPFTSRKICVTEDISNPFFAMFPPYNTRIILSLHSV